MPFIGGNKPTSVPLTSSDLADGIVSTTKLANSAVTDAKISGMSSSKLSGALPST